ncbi:hypothetical protein K439DRAFT_1639884, partial [Ramaria rubella]
NVAHITNLSSGSGSCPTQQRTCLHPEAKLQGSSGKLSEQPDILSWFTCVANLNMATLWATDHFHFERHRSISH